MGRTELPTDVLKGIHILLVEDDDDSREMIRTLLQYCSALVTAVSSAQDAMKTLAYVKPDILLTDIAMPRYDGYWLVRELRAMPAEQGGNIPAIAITAHGAAHGVERALAAGFQAHLRKPIDPWDLARTVANLVGRRA